MNHHVDNQLFQRRRVELALADVLLQQQRQLSNLRNSSLV